MRKFNTHVHISVMTSSYPQQPHLACVSVSSLSMKHTGLYSGGTAKPSCTVEASSFHASAKSRDATPVVVSSKSPVAPTLAPSVKG